jgi:hypothetical protein
MGAGEDGKKRFLAPFGGYHAFFSIHDLRFTIHEKISRKGAKGCRGFPPRRQGAKAQSAALIFAKTQIRNLDERH